MFCRLLVKRLWNEFKVAKNVVPSSVIDRLTPKYDVGAAHFISAKPTLRLLLPQHYRYLRKAWSVPRMVSPAILQDAR
jgi:hypothetical protein